MQLLRKILAFAGKRNGTEGMMFPDTVTTREPPSLPDFEAMAEAVRARGVRVGKRCHIFTDPVNFSTEPYLIELGDDVSIAAGVIFATHDGVVWSMRRDHPDMQVFGRITVGNGSLISTNAFILPGTAIGANCIIGAGSVVGGRIPANSLVHGNPARILEGRAGLLRRRLLRHPHRLDTLRLPPEERVRVIKAHFGIPETPSASATLP